MSVALLLKSLTLQGFPFSYGVFQEYYSALPLFASNTSGIAIIGTSASGIMYLGAPFNFFALQAWPHFRRISSIMGLAIIIIGLIASSFSTTVWHLILTQGILYAIGGSFLYAPAILYLDEWFIARKGFAFGVMWAGTGTSGIIIPFIMSWGLSTYGFRTILRVWALTLLILSSPLIYYVKPRIPVSHSSASIRRRTSFEFLAKPTFWFLQASNLLEGLGFFIPGIYLPSYARALGLSSVASSLTIALFNATSVLGQVGFGILIDRMHVTSVILISTIGATVSIFLVWGLSMGLPLLCIFALLYGVFGGGFTSTYSGMIKEVQRKTPSAETGTIFGLLAAGRGVGAVLSGPLSEALLRSGSWKGAAGMGYGTGYGPLIVFTGVTALCGGLSFVGNKARLMT
jgi:MFS family permease